MFKKIFSRFKERLQERKRKSKGEAEKNKVEKNDQGTTHASAAPTPLPTASAFPTASAQPYPNRFLKFYYQHHDRLKNERRSSYAERKSAGICVRCARPAAAGIVFCEYHQQRQKGYNLKARGKVDEERLTKRVDEERLTKRGS